MKNRLSSAMNPEVLLITNRGGHYGMGHYHRIRLLKEHLNKMKIKSNIEYGQEFGLESASAYKVILIDSRDDAFPENIINQKTGHQYFISLDNRGTGRNQGDIIWDTLPHPEMNLQELKTSLRNCILNPLIFQHHARSEKGNIIRCDLDDIESGRVKCDVVQYPLKKRSIVSVEEFQNRLIQAETVGTYFGQTFFEALYLGKQIYLYDISDYHKQISDWFYAKFQGHPDLINLLDGQGLHRLTVLIRSIVSGVLDFPAG